MRYETWDCEIDGHKWYIKKAHKDGTRLWKCRYCPIEYID